MHSHKGKEIAVSQIPNTIMSLKNKSKFQLLQNLDFSLWIVCILFPDSYFGGDPVSGRCADDAEIIAGRQF